MEGFSRLGLRLQAYLSQSTRENAPCGVGVSADSTGGGVGAALGRVTQLVKMAGDNADWASLPPELLVEVFQRVDGRAEGQEAAGEGRWMVTVAGVCRSWREIIVRKQLEGWQYPPRTDESRMSSELIQFPAGIHHPPPTNTYLQCVVKKRRNLITMHQLVNINGEASTNAIEERQYFLLNAWHEFACFKSRCRISTTPKRNFSLYGNSNPQSAATLVSNFWRSSFFLKKSSSSRSDSRHGGDPTLSRVHFEESHVDNRICQRDVFCTLLADSRAHRNSANSSEVWANSKGSKTSSLFKWSSSSLPKVDFRVSPKVSASECCNKSTAAAVSLKSKAPVWDPQTQCYNLGELGRSRATKRSIHNFQLVSATSGVSETVVLTLGKLGRGQYLLCFCAPLSPLEAFSICISSFSTEVGLGP